MTKTAQDTPDTHATEQFGKGLFVVVLGPDGSGKSTLLNTAKIRLAPKFTGIHHFHWRPGLLPTLGGNRGSSTPNDSPPQPPKDYAYGYTVSTIRYVYYFTDFLLGYWLKIAPRIRRGELVIAERWHLDSLINPVRYGFRVPQIMLRLGHRLLPRPDLTVLLTAPPHAIHARKPELSTTEIQTQLMCMLRVLPPMPMAAIVDTDIPLEQSVEILVGRVLAVADTDSLITAWRAFPRIGKTKVFLNKAHRFQNIAHIYTPRSTFAKLAVSIARKLPFRIVTRHITRAELSCLNTAYTWLKTNHACDNLAVDFYLGTPGRYQKLTGCASQSGGPIGYLKCGYGPAVSRQLRNEADALSSVVNCGLSPTLTAASFSSSYSAVFCSPPNGATSTWPEELDSREIAYLQCMAETTRSTKSLESILTYFGLDPATTFAGTPKYTQDILRDGLEFTQECFNNQQPFVTAAHGDFAPWNMLQTQNELPFIFDWEFYASETPALFDLYHRSYMVGWLRKGLSPNKLAKHLLDIESDTSLKGYLQSATGQATGYEPYLVSYLLILALRQLEETAEVNDHLIEVLRLTLVHAGFRNYLPRVLVSAYACEADQGSEPGVGWRWVEQISQQADTWVITRKNNRASIEKALSDRPDLHLHPIYVDLPKWASFWKRKQTGVRTYYYLWQFAALFETRRLQREIQFDIGHHVTFVNDWLWTFFSLTSIPYIWGPIGSHPHIPIRFVATMNERLKEFLRLGIQSTMRAIDPLFWLSAYRAERIVAINDASRMHVSLRIAARNRTSCVEPAIAVEDIPAGNERSAVRAMRVLFVGRFATIKAPLLALDAFADFHKTHPDATFTLIGRGPLDNALNRHILDYNLQDSVSVEGWGARDVVLETMRQADIFLFPSFEGGGMVVLEAMASGLPVVCLNYGGPGSMVDNNSGLRVELGSYWQTAAELSAALAKLSDDPVFYKRLSTGAVTHARSDFSWSAKGNHIREWYGQITVMPIRHIHDRDNMQ